MDTAWTLHELRADDDACFQPGLLSQPAASVSPTIGRIPHSIGGPNRLSVDVLRDSGRASSSYRHDNLPKGTVRASMRGVFTTNVGLRVPTHISSSFKVLSFNILAQRYATSDKYPDCPPLALSEAYRAPLIAAEIRMVNPDIIALQEISAEMYTGANLVGDLLRSDGYEGAHATITGPTGKDLSRADSGDSDFLGGERQDIEGVSIMFRASRFEPIPHCPQKRFCLCEVPASDVRLTSSERKRLMIGSHNVGLCFPLRCRETRKCYLFVTIHAYWDTSQHSAQLYQLDQLLKQVRDIQHTLKTSEGDENVSVVLLGDFNCELSMPPMHYLMQGSIELSSHNVEPISSWVPDEDGHQSSESGFTPLVSFTQGRRATRLITLRHPFQFDCAYAEYWRRDEHTNHVTAVNPSQGFRGCAVDHIFTEKGSLSVLDCVKLSSKRGTAGDYIPNESYPSDHFPIAATLIPTRILEEWAASSEGGVVDAEALSVALKQVAGADSPIEFLNECEDDSQPPWFMKAEQSLKNGPGQ